MQATHFRPALVLIVSGLMFSAAVPARADESSDGVARITDSRTPIPESQPVPAQPCLDCQDGGYGYGYGDDDFNSGRPHSPVSVWIRGNGNTYSPDHGWAPPVKYPIREVPVSYYRYWPNRWYGEPGAGLPANAPRFPVVYMPSDTTQLGIYYQRVPTWQPNPAMIPPAPWPSVWHRRDCPNAMRNAALVQGVVTEAQPTMGPAQSEPTLAPQPETQPATPPQLESQPPAPPQAEPQAIPVPPPAEESALNLEDDTSTN